MSGNKNALYPDVNDGGSLFVKDKHHNIMTIITSATNLILNESMFTAISVEKWLLHGPAEIL